MTKLLMLLPAASLALVLAAQNPAQAGEYSLLGERTVFPHASIILVDDDDDDDDDDRRWGRGWDRDDDDDDDDDRRGWRGYHGDDDDDDDDDD